MSRVAVLGFLGGIATIAIMGAILFGCAGRWDLPLFWAFLGVWLAATVVGVFAADPTLIQERMRPGPGGRDYVTAYALAPIWLGQLVLAGLDVGRFHWSDTVPLAAQVAGILAMAAAMAVLVWAESVNRFFSPVIRIQTERGHHVITTGPYRYVRHPGYAAALFLFVGGGLALGSWIAALIGLLLFVPILPGTVKEDRILHEQLEGYAEYAQRVRFRLIPGVW
jgi:protein-S-isoprenylcysteine O-methyltransferase Ste14